MLNPKGNITSLRTNKMDLEKFFWRISMDLRKFFDMSIDLGGIVETSRGRQAKSRRTPETEAVGFLESGLELMSRMGK